MHHSLVRHCSVDSAVFLLLLYLLVLIPALVIGLLLLLEFIERVLLCVIMGYLDVEAGLDKRCFHYHWFDYCGLDYFFRLTATAVTTVAA